MEYDNLVNLIVEEIYNKIRESPRNNNTRKKAVVMQKDNIEKYYEILGNEYDLVSYDESIKDCDVLIVPRLCLRGMGNLANLTCSTKEEHFIIKVLMNGKKVYIMEDGMYYKKYKNTAPKQLYNKYLDFERQLISYGIEILSSSFNNTYGVEDDKYQNNIKDINSKISMSKSSEITNKKLISEADIRKQYISGSRTIVIDSKSIVTPLARDFIRNNHIEIMRKSGE